MAFPSRLGSHSRNISRGLQIILWYPKNLKYKYSFDQVTDFNPAGDGGKNTHTALQIALSYFYYSIIDTIDTAVFYVACTALLIRLILSMHLLILQRSTDSYEQPWNTPPCFLVREPHLQVCDSATLFCLFFPAGALDGSHVSMLRTLSLK